MSNRLLTSIIVVLTLPLAIFICRGRTLETPHRHITAAMLLTARLKERATLQAQRHESAYSLRVHRHNALIGRERA